MFWAIAVGIVTGASFYLLAIIGSVIIGIILLVFANFKSQTSPYILMLDYGELRGRESDPRKAEG